LQARYTQEITAICADTSKALVNRRCSEVVNIRSIKMMNRRDRAMTGTVAACVVMVGLDARSYSVSEALIANSAFLSAGKSSFTAFQMIWPSIR
jgi:hypothetical protein